jgi:small-conductance mechanosensitive channel
MLQDVAHDLQSKLAVLNGLRAYAPAWAVSLVIVIIALALAWLLHATILTALRRLLRARKPYLRTILEATKDPTRLAFLIAALAVALPATPVDSDTQLVLGKMLALATIGLIGWIALTVLQISANLYLLRFRIDVADDLMARKHLTQVRVMVRVLDTIIVLLTLGFALMTFDSVRQYGVSLFASAGVAGVVFGLAAQPVLSNLIAGVQLALTQPIRLEDAVTVQNEYGWIEEINATYVVIRLWDLRRLIVPLNFFMQQPFYNWTRQAAANIGTVALYLDYCAPIDRIRAKTAEIVAQSQIDGAKTVSVQVTNASAQAIEVKALVTALNTAGTSDLCAEVREKLIGFLQREHPEALPRQRNEIAEAPNRKMGEPPQTPS